MELIPEEKWIIGDFSNNVGCCAIGHWNVAHGDHSASITKSTYRFTESVGKYFEAYKGYYQTIDGVNDGGCDEYQQATPKQRVMALLDDMIAAGL